MLRKRLKSPFLWAGAAVWAASLGLYLATLAPTLTWGREKFGVDGGELLAAANTLGIPHPPGYPTYMLLLKAFATLVPVGDFAHRGNLLSAVLASGSVVLLYWAILRFAQYLRPEGPRSHWIASAALGSATLAASPLFWSQAIITEVYALNALFVSALLLVASHLAMRLPWEGERDERHTTVGLTLFGLLLGLGLGNHLTLLAVAVPLLLWIWTALGWRRLVSPWAVGSLAVGLGVYLYLPIRAAQNPLVNWGNASTLDGMAWMLSGRVYQDYVFGVPAGSIPSRFVEWLGMVFSQFNPLGLFLGLMAMVPLRSRALGFLVVSLASMAVLSAYGINYLTVDWQVLTIPTIVLFSLWIGVGFLWVLSHLSAWAHVATRKLKSGRLGLGTAKAAASRSTLVATVVVLGALPVTSVILNYGSQNLRGDRQAYEYAREVVDAIPEGSLVMSTEEDTAFSLWYMAFVEERDRDILPIAVPLIQFDWYRRDVHDRFPERFPADSPDDIRDALKTIVEHNEGGARVYFTYLDQFLEDNFQLERQGKIYEVRPKTEP